jgi:hypothetical protein
MINKITDFINKARVAKNSMKSMLKDDSAMANMSGGKGGVFGKIVGLFIVAILIGSLFVSGLQQLAQANTSSLSASQVALIAVVGLILIVGVLWLILEYVGLV